MKMAMNGAVPIGTLDRATSRSAKRWARRICSPSASRGGGGRLARAAGLRPWERLRAGPAQQARVGRASFGSVRRNRHFSTGSRTRCSPNDEHFHLADSGPTPRPRSAAGQCVRRRRPRTSMSPERGAERAVFERSQRDGVRARHLAGSIPGWGTRPLGRRGSLQ